MAAPCCISACTILSHSGCVPVQCLLAWFLPWILSHLPHRGSVHYSLKTCEYCSLPSFVWHTYTCIWHFNIIFSLRPSICTTFALLYPTFQFPTRTVTKQDHGCHGSGKSRKFQNSQKPGNLGKSLHKFWNVFSSGKSLIWSGRSQGISFLQMYWQPWRTFLLNSIFVLIWWWQHFLYFRFAAMSDQSFRGLSVCPLYMTW